MRTRFLLQPFVIAFALSIFFLSNTTPVNSHHCREDQKHLLLKLKDDLVLNTNFSCVLDTIFSREKKLARWSNSSYEGNCCNWDGVGCDDSGRVISLELDGEGILGGIQHLTNLFSLKHLKKLNLAWNRLNNTQILQKLSCLTNLMYLNVSNNNLFGQIPIQVSRMQRLVTLDLSNNFNLGSHVELLKLEYPNLQMLVENLLELRELRLDMVNISSEVPDVFGSFPNLTTLSLSSCSLQGSFPEKILKVSTLQNLDLSDNRLLGGSLPEFQKGHSLRTLVIWGTNFSGSIPNSINNIVNLSKIDLSNCNFNGAIPSIITNLKQLVYLDLSLNNFTGSIPHSLFTLPLLQQLQLSNNLFDGQIEEIPQLLASPLNYLDLSYNRLEGPIPKFFFQLENITRLLLSSNFFNGTIPEKMYLPRLTRLDLSTNNIRGEIPNWISQIGSGSLRELNLSFNLLTGLKEPYSFPHLNVLDLRSNQLRGKLPTLPFNCSYVDLSNNNFSGSIPANIGTFISASSFFSVANNSLVGEIPKSICNSTRLYALDLSNNALIGSIPSCLMENEYLMALNLGRNKLNGTVPDVFPVNCSLVTLDLSGNVLQGNVPRSLLNCGLLEVLNIGNNMIEDNFPCILQNSVFLRVLILRSNRFHGNFHCTEKNKGWSSLQIFDISSNNFSGHLSSSYFSNWFAMMTHESGGYIPFQLTHIASKEEDEFTATIDIGVTVIITTKGIDIMLVKFREDFISIDLSGNNFQGEIPYSLWDLRALYSLNLSHNAFRGTIPASISNFTWLETLDLSVNHLNGKIPEEFASLTSLSSFNVSFNQLFGRIPQGRQLQTFTSTSYEGNEGLCGFPLNKSCDLYKANRTSSSMFEVNFSYEINGCYISATLGYIFGLGIIIWILLFCPHLRERYFNRVDQLLLRAFGQQQTGRRRPRNQTRRT